MNQINKGANETEKRLIELESNLLEQEHRPFRLILNYLNRKKWPEGDKRTLAVKKAILFRLIFSPTTIALTGTGIISLFTLYFMFRQTSLFEAQNKLFQSQNKRIEQQTQLAEASRRSTQMFIMGEVLSDINKELENEKNSKRILSDALVGRVISLSSAMKPYKYLENDSLIVYSISPERGQMLLALIESNIDDFFLRERILKKADFKFADLTYTELKDIKLNDINIRGSNFNFANIKNVNFSSSILYSSVFVNATLIDVDFSSAKLYKADFSNSYLSKINFDGAELIKTNFSNTNFAYFSFQDAIVDREDWISYIKDSLKLNWGISLEKNYKLYKKNTFVTGSGEDLNIRHTYVLGKKDQN